MKEKHGTLLKGNRKYSITAFVTLILVLVFAILLDSIITYIVLRNNTERSTFFLLNQTEHVHKNNSSDETMQMEEQKTAFKSAAQALSYIVSENPEVVDDFDELNRIAGLLSVDELHIFDDKGTIIAGTNPEYYGMNINEGEQISFFKPLLSDKSLVLCQDIMPNTASGKNMMYAATWNESGTLIVQVGIEPRRLLNILKKHEISYQISEMTLAEGFNIYAFDSETKELVGSSDENLTTGSMDQLLEGKLYDLESHKHGKIFRNENKTYYANLRVIDNYLVVVVYDTTVGKVYFMLPIIIITLYLFIAGLIILGLFAQLQRVNEENKEELQDKYKEILELSETIKTDNDKIQKQNNILYAMSESYYSVHLINIPEDTVVAYNQSGKVAEIVNKSTGAVEMMREVMKMTIVPSYNAAAMEFTDLTTLSGRMRGKKIISKELLGKNIGWISASFISVEEDDNGFPVQVVFTTKWINEEKVKEENLVYMSNTDELTGLYNRRAYEDAVKYYEDNEMEAGFVYISLDINGLKRVNDSIGHDAGDELIVGASDCMKRCLSPHGRLFRIGGDEFVALLVLKDISADTLIEELEHETYKWKGTKTDQLSLAIGYVSANEVEDNSLQEISILADKRMYSSKTMHYRKKGIDRRSQSDAHRVLCTLYAKILKINLSKDSYEIINMDISEMDPEKGFADTISGWLRDFGKSGNVHPEDVDNYLELTNIKYIEDYFANGKTSLHIFYRRKYGEEFRQSMMEIVPTEKYSKENQELFLYVKEIDAVI